MACVAAEHLIPPKKGSDFSHRYANTEIHQEKSTLKAAPSIKGKHSNTSRYDNNKGSEIKPSDYIEEEIIFARSTLKRLSDQTLNLKGDKMLAPGLQKQYSQEKKILTALEIYKTSIPSHLTLTEVQEAIDRIRDENGSRDDSFSIAGLLF
jgi:hypothetical protein